MLIPCQWQEIDEGDQAILESFGGGGTRNLADLIMAKIQEREANDKPIDGTSELYSRSAFADSLPAVPEVSRSTGLDPKVIEVYTR